MKINNKIVFCLIMAVTVMAIGFKIYSNNIKNDEGKNINQENNIENVMDMSLISNEENIVNNEKTKSTSNIITITEANFEENVINSDKIIIVDFWASWCNPCTYMSPILEEIAEENDNIILGKVNVDNEEALSMKYQITMIPTMIIFKDGKEEKQVVGVISKEKMLEYINEIK